MLFFAKKLKIPNADVRHLRVFGKKLAIMLGFLSFGVAHLVELLVCVQKISGFWFGFLTCHALVCPWDRQLTLTLKTINANYEDNVNVKGYFGVKDD